MRGRVTGVQPLENFVLWPAAMLALLYSVASLFQFDATGLASLGVFAAWLWVWRGRSPATVWPRESLFWVCVVFLLVWVGVSGYIPWRDNDAWQFWMPKAAALARFGHLPQLSASDPSYTLHPSYPIGLVSLSGWLHSFLGGFSWMLHRYSLAILSIGIWMAYFRIRSPFEKRKLWIFLALVVPQISLWANGYHDVIWALAACVALCLSLQDEPLASVAPLWIIAMLGKNEGLVFASLMLLGVMLYTRRLDLIGLFAVPALWSATRQVRGWSTELYFNFVEAPHAFSEVVSQIFKESAPILSFGSSHGMAALCFWTSSYLLVRMWRRWGIWFFLIPLSVYLATYGFSRLDLGWHIRFSWPRLMLFPMIWIMMISLIEPQKKRATSDQKSSG
jgi:hypothetical protein